MKIDENIIKKAIEFLVSLFKDKAPAPAPAPAASVNKTEPPVISPNVVSVDMSPHDIGWHQIDWNDSKAKISNHFSVHEALFLNSWNAQHIPTDDEKDAIKGIADKVEQALEIISKELNIKAACNVHAWIRPEVANIPGSEWNGKDYNRYIYETQVWKDLSEEEKAKKTVPKSSHRTGHAVDFHIVGYEGKAGCKKIRDLLVPHLESLGLRMEDMDGGWIHLDNKPLEPGHHRFFKP